MKKDKQNPYQEWTEDSIGDALFELRQWIVEDWLNKQKDEFQHSECLGSDPLNNSDCGFDQYNKYNQLNDALMHVMNDSKCAFDRCENNAEHNCALCKDCYEELNNKDK